MAKEGWGGVGWGGVSLSLWLGTVNDSHTFKTRTHTDEETRLCIDEQERGELPGPDKQVLHILSYVNKLKSAGARTPTHTHTLWLNCCR